MDIKAETLERAKRDSVLFTAAAGQETLTGGMTLLRLIPAAFETTLRFVRNVRGGETTVLTLRPEEAKQKIMSYWIDHRQLPVTDRLEFIIGDIAELARISAESERATLLQASFHNVGDKIEPFMPHSGLRLIYDTMPDDPSWAVTQLSDDTRVKLGDLAMYIDLVAIESAPGKPVHSGARREAFLSRLETYKTQLGEQHYPGASEISPDLQARIVDINWALLSRDPSFVTNGDGYDGMPIVDSPYGVWKPQMALETGGSGEGYVEQKHEAMEEEEDSMEAVAMIGADEGNESGHAPHPGGGAAVGGAAFAHDAEAHYAHTNIPHTADHVAHVSHGAYEAEDAVRERNEETQRAVEEQNKERLAEAAGLRAAHDKAQGMIARLNGGGRGFVPADLLAGARQLRQSLSAYGEEAAVLGEAIAEREALNQEVLLEKREAEEARHENDHEVQEAAHDAEHKNVPHYATAHYAKADYATVHFPGPAKYDELRYPGPAHFAHSEHPETPPGPGSPESQEAVARAAEAAGGPEPAGPEREAAAPGEEPPENRITQTPEVGEQAERRVEQAREELAKGPEQSGDRPEPEKQEDHNDSHDEHKNEQHNDEGHKDDERDERENRDEPEPGRRRERDARQERELRDDRRPEPRERAARYREDRDDDRPISHEAALDSLHHLMPHPGPHPLEHIAGGHIYAPLRDVSATHAAYATAAPGSPMLQGMGGADAVKSFSLAANISTHWPGEWAPLGKTQFALGNFKMRPGIDYALGAITAAVWPGAAKPKADPVGKYTHSIIQNHNASPRKDIKMKAPNFGHSFADLFAMFPTPSPGGGSPEEG